jgi:hypothetical protein
MVKGYGPKNEIKRPTAQEYNVRIIGLGPYRSLEWTGLILIYDQFEIVTVGGMNYGAHHGSGSMPAGVPGIPTVQHEQTGSACRAGCASSRLVTPLRRAGAGR